ncbi:MAG: hypothetical protein LDL33_03235 [Desulfomonile sp.]|nr:hypothetical protein [Desulfomonile sp.]
MPLPFTRKEFLYALYEEYFRQYEGFILVKILKILDHRISTRYFPSIDILARQDFMEDQNVFFGVCPRESMKPRPDTVYRLPALWAALDFSAEGHSGRESYFKLLSQAALSVRRFPHPPSIIVESGWGLHLYWLMRDFSTPIEARRAERLLRGINNYFHCTGPISIESTLRLPGTVNSKLPSEPAPCRVKYLNPEFRYSIQDFEQLDARFIGTANATQAAVMSDEQVAAVTAAVEPIDQATTEVLSNAMDQSIEVLDEFSPEEFADRVADRLLQRLKAELVDEIVEKLAARLGLPGSYG